MLYTNNQENNCSQAHIQLLTRVRPLHAVDHVLPTPYFQVDPPRGTIILGGKQLFQFDYVLPFDCPQEILYKGYVETLVNTCFEGYNISIIAYGQTGSGKTYTVFGPGLLFAMNEADFGLVPRAVRHIFYKKKEYPGRTFSIQASYLEIYDGEIQDLLSAEPFHGEITIQEDTNGETIVTGATRMECQTIDDVFSCLETGLSLRHTGPMMLNQLSSRSHGIFTIYIQQAWTQNGCLYEVRSKLHFVDLAGSERLSGIHVEGGTNSATVFTEPSPINSGLLALSSVTAALGDPRRKASHIPYWDSKLTCILKDSLGGNALTLLIVCLSPSASDLEETMNTLKFASTAANISNRPVSNVKITPISNIVNPVINQQQFIPIGTPAHLYPSLPYGAYPSQSNVSQANHHNLNTFDNDNVKKEDATEDNQIEDELFKLRFAASQWQQLVTNAECLLNELVNKGSLADDTQNRIKSWLCLKEEYQHCIDPDLYAMKPRIKNQGDPNGNHSINTQNTVLGLPRTDDSKTLHVIEEVSEPTPTHDSSSSISDEAESFDNSSSSDSSHFTEQLDLLRQKFRETTDRLISSIETGFDSVLVQEWTKLNPVTLESTASLRETPSCESPFKNQAACGRRRVSIFTAVNQDLLSPMGATSSSSRSSYSRSSSAERPAENDDAVEDSEGEECEHDIRQEMRRLSETSESRRLQVFQTNKQLKEAQETLMELRKAIKLKEEFINDLAEAGRESELSKQKFEEKIERLEQDAAQTRSDLAEAQIRLRDLEDQSLHRNRHSDGKNDSANPESDSETHCERIKRYQREISRYESRLMDMAKLLDLTGRSPRKVEELERSLTAMKEQQSHLKEQLRLESERKKELKLELENDHQRIVQLERQLKEKRRSRRKSPDPLTSNGDQDIGESELEHKWRWLVAEEERLVEMRTAIQWQSEELEERQSVLDKREMALDKSHQSEGDRQLSGSIELGARRKKDPVYEDKMIQTSTKEETGSGEKQLAVSLKEACADKETVRKEIRKLRHTRDSLVQQRQELDERQHRGRELDSAEERRLLELDEAIEAVDAAIEYKNEVICSRTRELKSPTETGLLTRLMSLTHVETRSLLCKYFHKVIDLREGSRKMEQQFAELESQFEDQSRYVWKLSSALKHTQLEVERRSTNHQRHYEQKTSQFSGQSPSSAGRNAEGSSSAQRKLRQLDDDYNQQRDNRDLRKHLRELLSVTPKHRAADGGAAAVDGAASACSSRAPSLSGLHAVQALHDKIQGLQRLKGRQPSPATTTTVTREKNKLIIKQQSVENKQTKRRGQR